MARISLCNQLIPSLLVPMKQRSHYQLMGVFGLTRGRRFSASSSPKISMSLKAGIVGLPNVGKSTLFNAVVENGKAQAANFPFCTIEPNVGIVAVPDPRLNVLSDLSKSQRVVPASLELVDIAGLVKGASQGEGLGNKFLSNIREVDSILQVVRCFEDNDVVHVNGKVDPKDDIDVINLELIFSDLDQIEKRMEKLKKSKTKDSQSKLKEESERSGLERIQQALMDGKPARSVTLTDTENESIKHLCLLTMKPVIYVANVAESDLAEPGENPHVKALMNLASELQCGVVTISAQVESELTELPSEERTEFLESLGVGESGLGNLIRTTYSVLGLRTYFTSGEKETKAWTILAGMTAPQAAGVIHSDFEKGFIRAETVSYDDFVAAGSLAAARERGVLRSEGKDYIVQEGDVMLFRFNV
uniref:obg-like ATPase 1 isoform X1 n=1 Tax=Fragaria vesca subsp. vesca TaxID=101020 RepID=UPI0005CACF53|nr:PREDICTED: obg-like ATPase 1 isoform X1 [Fragaria vesca subsp. vesca]